MNVLRPFRAYRATSIVALVALGYYISVGSLPALLAAVAPPPAPVNLRGTVTGSAVSFTWSPGSGRAAKSAIGWKRAAPPAPATWP